MPSSIEAGLSTLENRNQKISTLFQRYNVEIEQAYEAIDQAHVLIKALWAATDRIPSGCSAEVGCGSGPRS